MRYLLDTSALLAHYRQEPGWEDVQALFESDQAEIIVASVSLAEFARRLHDLGAGEEAAGETLTSYELLFGEVAPVDAARGAFVIGCRTPRRLPLVDALIAAAAQARAATLVHRDEHMRLIPPDLVQQYDLDTPPQR
ncbi:MAG: PIN domain-containing protein [Chloroflexi bacterium]|nr:PIN domain-containing protein [Chloroflexota bacterium]